VLAAYVESFNPDDPVAALVVGDRPEPQAEQGWTVIDVRAAAINHHDIWSLRGVGLREEFLPMILGCDAAGIDADGNEVVVHGVVNDPAWTGDPALDPKLSLFSERYQGTLAERVAVPVRNLIPKPAELSFEEAACLPTAWLTAYRMLFTQADARPGQIVLVQGATGGLATALVALGKVAGVRMWVTSRSDEGRALATELGADAVFDSGERLPERVDAVMDSVGGPTWKHSLRSLKKGGVMVVSGGTGGYTAEAEVPRIFALNLRIAGSTMGTREEFTQLLRLVADTGVRPPIDRVIPLADARDGVAAMVAGGLRGKVVLRNG
jgi:NADPH:quinone reductase-like Zn-dependent oxidoreductase